MNQYISLHQHSYYSVLDGLLRPIELAKWAKQHNMPAVALTDHGVLTGWPEFALACQDQGVKPIFGVEAYVVPDRLDHRVFKSPTGKDVRTGYHLTLLAKNFQGYRNLITLNNIAQMEGFFYSPKIDWQTLVNHREGLIVSSACLASELNQHLMAKRFDEAVEIAKRFKDVFGKDFFLEVMFNYMPGGDQKTVNDGVIMLAKKLDIKIIPTNDAHYARAEDRDIHDIALCLQTKKLFHDPARMKYEGLFHLKSPEEMFKLFPDYMKNTFEIAERVESFDIFSKTMNLPVLVEDPDAMLESLVIQGLRERGIEDKPSYQERHQRELQTIKKLKMSSYFLATKNIVDMVRSSNCALGWGRGSAGGSLICYALGITNVDPLQYGLLFERFVNEYRKDWPDIDLDVAQSRRKEVIKNIMLKFGQDRVAHISTVSFMKPRSMLRDICRTMGLPVSEADRLSKMVPFEADRIKDWTKLEPHLEALKEELSKVNIKTNTGMVNGDIIWKTLQGLYMMPRHVGVHASGIIVSKDPIVEHLPIRVERSTAKSEKGEVDQLSKFVVQYTMHHINNFGFLKFDILGLKNLDIITGAAKDAGIDINQIPLNDPKVFDALANGRVAGVFQMDDSKTAVDIAKQMKPKTLEEIAVLIALNRPGLTDSGQLESYLRRRQGLEPVTYLHHSMKEVLESNYGICVYQEDMMKLAQAFAGYTLHEAEELRKGIGKKDPEIIEKTKKLFADKATKLERDPKQISEVLNMIDAAGNYSFNKSHAVGYAMITYACIYMAENYSLQFLKHVINLSETTDRQYYISEAMARGIKILPPDANLSEQDVSIEDQALRLGLRSMKGIGEAATGKIIAGRPYKNIKDLIKSVPKNIVSILYTVRGVESIPDYQTFKPSELGDEVDILGISLFGLKEKYQDILEYKKIKPIHKIDGGAGYAVVRVLDCREWITKKKDPMGFLTLMDVHGPQVDAIVFTPTYKKKLFEKNKMLVVVLERSSRGGWMVTRARSVDEVRCEILIGSESAIV